MSLSLPAWTLQTPKFSSKLYKNKSTRSILLKSCKLRSVILRISQNRTERCQFIYCARRYNKTRQHPTCGIFPTAHPLYNRTSSSRFAFTRQNVTQVTLECLMRNYLGFCSSLFRQETLFCRHLVVTCQVGGTHNGTKSGENKCCTVISSHTVYS